MKSVSKNEVTGFVQLEKHPKHTFKLEHLTTLVEN